MMQPLHCAVMRCDGALQALELSGSVTAACFMGLPALPNLQDLRIDLLDHNPGQDRAGTVLAQLTGVTRLSMYGANTGSHPLGTQSIPAAICSITALQLLNFEGPHGAYFHWERGWDSIGQLH